MDQALETSAGMSVPWGGTEAMIIRRHPGDDEALVILGLTFNSPKTIDHGGLRRRLVAAHTLCQLTAMTTSTLTLLGLGAEHWALAVFGWTAAAVAV